ncbi:GvpT/GvpP family gas vesicle accessory protein [Neobacillus vireti]|uniref:GvpT/GvpP family gas vesicle accessory protein n=1 Tax=Neobacillus vireti TaxID=220686 RepID=UPI0030009741
MKETKTMENQTEETKNKQNETEEGKNTSSSNSSQIKRSLAGGVIGAAVGYLATPENRKKLMETVSADNLKSTGSDLGQAVKEKSKNAVGSIKNSASKLFTKQDNDSQGEKTETSPSGDQQSKQEGSSINDRLTHIEELLAKLTSDEKGQGQGQKKSQHDDKLTNETSLSNGVSEEQEGSQEQEDSSSKESESYLQRPSKGQFKDPNNSEESQSQLKGQDDSGGTNLQQEDQAETDGNNDLNNKDYEAVKKENQQLQDRLGKIEEMLTKMIQEKKDQGEKHHHNDESENEGKLRAPSQPNTNREENEEKSQHGQKKDQAENEEVTQGGKKNGLTDNENKSSAATDQDNREEADTAEDDKDDKINKKKLDASNGEKEQENNKKTNKNDKFSKNNNANPGNKELKFNQSDEEDKEGYTVLKEDEETYLLLDGMRRES